MKNPIIRIAQAGPGAEAPAPPPPPPADMGGGGPPLPPLGGLDMGGGMPPPGGPGAPPAGGPGLQAKIIKEPLENLGMILADVDIKKILSEKLSNTPKIDTTGEEEIANSDVWQVYGGDELGGIIPGRVGERLKKQQVDDSEIEKTDETRWKRLPKGKNLIDLGITLQNVEDAVKSISFSMSKEMASNKGGGPMAYTKDQIIRIAQQLDKLGFYKEADIVLK